MHIDTISKHICQALKLLSKFVKLVSLSIFRGLMFHHIIVSYKALKAKFRRKMLFWAMILDHHSYSKEHIH